MANLKLPEIEPARSFRGAEADAIERAGSQFNVAFQSMGEVALQRTKALTIAQSEDAALAKAQAQAEFDAELAANEEFSAAVIRKRFPGGEVPPEVETKLTVPMGDKLVDRPNVRFHEVAPHLYKAQSELQSQAATAGIEAPGFRDRALRAMRLDDMQRTETIRAKALAVEDRVLAIGNVKRFDAYIDLGTEEGFASAWRVANQTTDPEVQAKLKAAYPEARANSEAASAVRSAASFEDLDAAEVKVAGNEFFAPLSKRDQDHYLTAIAQKREAIRKAAYAAKLQGYDTVVQRVENGEFGDPRTFLLAHPEIRPPTDIEDQDYNVRRDRLNKLRAGEGVTDNNRLYLSIYNNPEKYRGMSEEDFARAIAYQFTVPREQELMRLYADRKAGKNTEPVLSSVERDAVKRAARHSLKIDPGATPSLEQDMALAQAEQDIEMQMTARKRLKPDEPITYRAAYEARSRQTAVNTTAEKGIVVTRPMTDPERQKFYNLDDPATAEAWGRLWKRTHGGAPVVSNSELYDMIDNATKEWGADVENAWAVNPLEKTPHLTATVIARLADPRHVAEVIDPKLPADSKADPKVLRRRRALAAVQLSTPSGAEGLQAKLAEQEAAVVRAEQLGEAVKRKEASPRVALADQAFKLATRDMPGGPKTYDWWTGKMPAEAQGAARAAWESDMSKRRVMAETAVEQYEQYLSRNGVDPGQPGFEVAARAKRLYGFGEFFARFEKGVAP